ncbi:MAG: hypothetical protein WA478_18260, partial [Pseudolabrys sp.]
HSQGRQILRPDPCLDLASEPGQLARACTHKCAGNVGFRGNSGRGLGVAECPLMTDAVEKVGVSVGTSRLALEGR